MSCRAKKYRCEAKNKYDCPYVDNGECTKRGPKWSNCSVFYAGSSIWRKK